MPELAQAAHRPDPARAGLPAVVITRPRQQADALAQAVAALGRTAVVLPLLQIAPLADPAPLRAALEALEAPHDPAALVAFVSPNAIDAAFAQLGAWPARVPIAIVGEGSRAALARHGVASPAYAIFSPADSAHSDSEHLLASLDLAALAGRRVLIVRGDGGRELLADALRAAGARVEALTAYRRSVPPLDDELRSRLRVLLAQPNDWIITSSEALRGLAQLAARIDPDGAGAMDALRAQHLIVPHARIAATAQALGFTRVTETGSGDARLLAALQSQ